MTKCSERLPIKIQLNTYINNTVGVEMCRKGQLVFYFIHHQIVNEMN